MGGTTSTMPSPGTVFDNDRRLTVIDSWNALNTDALVIVNILNIAWLRAAQASPSWIWGIVNVDEAMQRNASKNAQFQHIIQQVKEYLALLIKVHRAEATATQLLSLRLGTRHRHYHPFLHAAYWQPFPLALAEGISASYQLRDPTILGEDGERECMSCRGAVARAHTSEEVRVAWITFMGIIVDAMMIGYQGREAPTTSLRLSITNSIISMTSLRSLHSRGTNESSPRLQGHNISQSRSIRSRSACHSKQGEEEAKRRLSSPNNRNSTLTENLRRQRRHSVHANLSRKSII